MPVPSTTRTTASVRSCFWNPGEEEDEGEKIESKGGDDEKVAGPPKMEFSSNVGVQFGLTDATSDLRTEISSFAVFLANASL